jgi:hypothetical protein
MHKDDVELYRWLKTKAFSELVDEGIPRYLSDDPAFGLCELAVHLQIPMLVAKGLIDRLADEIRLRDADIKKTIAARAARMARPTPRPARVGVGG